MRYYTYVFVLAARIGIFSEKSDLYERSWVSPGGNRTTLGVWLQMPGYRMVEIRVRLRLLHGEGNLGIPPSQCIYLPDKVAGYLCGIPDIDPAVAVEVSNKIFWLLPDDHVGHLRDVTPDCDDGVAREITICILPTSVFSGTGARALS